MHSLTETRCNSALARPWLPLLLVATLLGGCAGTPVRSVSVGAEDVQAAPAWPAAAVKDYERALGLMDAGRDAEAAERLVALADRYPEYSGPLTNLGILAARRGDTEQALNYLTLATSLCTTCAPAWNQLGILHREQGRFDAAEQAYQQALASDPDYALAHYNLGVLYDLYQQRHETAVAHYERYVLLAEDLNNVDEVDRWIADLRRRLGEPPRTAQIGGAQ